MLDSSVMILGASTMVRKLVLAAVVFVCLILATACDSFSTEPGSFVVLFQWETGHEPDTAAKEYYIWAYYQEWKGGEGKTFPADIESNAKSLDEAGPVKLGSGDDLNFTKLTYGDNRFVRAAIWDNEERSGDPLYVGVSELFNFSASDRNKAVAVNMKLQANAGVDENGTGGSFAIEVRQGAVVATRVGQPTVTLRLTVKNADTVIIANDLNFEKGIIEKKLTELTKIDETTYELADWDVTEGWTDLGDALYSVFGKSKNTLGYESAPKRADVYLDTTAPVPNVTPFPTVAKLSDTIEVRFSFDEEVDPAALEIAWGGLAFTLADNKANKSYTYTYTVTDTDDEKEYTFSLTASDGVGNATEAFELGKVTIDRTLPSISGITVAGTDGKETLRSGDVLTVSFTASEELSADPVVKIDDKTLTLDTKDGLDYTYTYTVTGGDITGIKTITASLRDLAKNDATVSIGQTIFDNILPLLMGVETTPARAKKGIPIEAVLSFSEPVDPAKVTLIAVFDDDPTKEIAFTLTGPSVDDQSFSFSHTVDDLDLEGNYTIRVEATDTAGNEIAEDQKEVGDTVIDKTAPTVSDLTIGGIDPLIPVKAGTAFTVSFTVSEEIKPESLLEIGKLQVRLDAADCVASGLDYTCSHAVDPAEGDGTKHVAVAAVDLAGNLTREPYADPVIYDTADPVLINALVNPADRVGLGQKLVVLFSLSETPSSYDFDGDGLDFTGEVTPDGLSHTYTHIVAGTDEERTYNFTASVTDLAGNTLDPVAIGSVLVDITPPDVASHDLSATNVKLGAEFTLSFTVTEELKTIPTVLIGAKNISSECTVDGLDYTCTHAAAADEGDGVKQIALQLTDLAGNTTGRTLKDAADQYVTIEYDVTAPEVVNPVIAPEKANLGAVIDVRFSFTEDVEGVVIDWGLLDGKFTRFNEDTNKRLFIFKHTVDGSDDEGSFPVTITAATDMAGNPIAGTIAIGSVAIDNTAPTLSGPDVAVNGDTDKSLAKEGDTVTISFTVAETIAEHTVRIGLIEVAGCTFDDGTQQYTCTHTVQQSDGEGAKDITVELKDEAGNADTYAVGQVSFDMTDAELANTIILPTKSNKATLKVEVKFSFTEEVVMTALSDGGLGLAGANCPLNGVPRRDFVCDYTFAVGDTQVNDYPVTVSATDKAGNDATGLIIGTVSIDREIPTLIAQDVAPQTLKLGDEFIISFTASETLEGDPIVKVGALQLGAYTQKIGNAYEYRHTAAPEEGDGSKLITVAFQDPAGNSASIDLADTVTYDTTSPAPLNPTVSPETANRQTTAIDVRFSFPEDVEAVTLVGNKLSGDAGAPVTGDFACTAQGSAKSWKCTASLVGVTWEIAVYELWVNGRDLAGNYINPADETNGEALGLNAVIDRKRPVISGEAVTQCTGIDCTTPKTISKAGDAVRVSFEIDETPPTAPLVSIAGRLATACPGPATYDYCIVVDAADGDGEKEVRIETVDEAGNIMVKTLAGKPRFDVTDPALLNPIVTPQKANGTSTITVTFSFSEEILPGAMSVASAGGLLFACVTTDNKSYTCTRSVTAGDGAGYAIVAAATDAAGNSATGLAVGSVEIDRVNPLVGTVTLNLWNAAMTLAKTVVKAGDTVELIFSVTKTLGSDPVVSIAGQPMTKSAQNGLDYTYLYTVQTADGDGLKAIRVELTDEYDNHSSTTLTETAAFDVTAPAILNPVISPEKANATSVVTASFSFSEEIDPLKMTVLSDGGLAFTCSTPDQKTYVCTRTVQVADGGGYDILVDAEDTAGNSITGETIGSVAIDRIDPAVVSPILTLWNSGMTGNKTVVTAGDKVRVTFTSSDILKNDPVVQIAGQAMTKTAQAGLNYTYQYTVQATDGDGQKQVRIELTDEYDNHSSTTLASTAPFDVTAPAALNPVIVPLKANASSLIRVAFSFSEAILPATVTVRSNDGQSLAYGCSTSDNKQYLCTRSVALADGAGYGILVSATDAAGNTLTDSLLGTFTIDRVLPTANNPVLTLWNSGMTANKTVVTALDKVRVTFTASETLKNDPQVQIGGQLMTKTAQAGLDYTYQYTVQASDGDGQKTVRIEMTDQSDNTGATTLGSTAPFDVTVPAVLNPIIAPTKANASSTIVVRFSFSEEILLANMSVSSAGGLSFSCATSDNKQYVCGRVVQLADNNGYDIVVDATDAAGNTLTDEIIGAVSIDRIAPTADSPNATFWNAALTVQKSSITTGDKVVVTFTASETLGSDPVVTVGGQIMTQTAKVGLNYAYRYTVQASDGDGQKQIRVYLVDQSDNSTNTILAQTAPFDVTAPSVLNPTVSPAYAKQGAVVTASFSFTEPITSGNVTISGNGVLTFTCTSGDNVVYSCTHTVGSTDAQQAYTLAVAAVDAAGNTLSATTLGTFTVDRTLPAITAETLYLLASDGVTFKTPLKAGDKVRYEFDVNDTLGRTPVVRIGGSTMTATGCTGTRAYAYCYTVQSTDGDGSKTITTELEDRAANQNTVTAASTAPFDVTVPTLISPTVTPTYAMVGAVVKATFNYSETVSNMTFNWNGLTSGSSCTTSDNKSYTCTHTVLAGDTQTTYNFTATATDAAGNTTGYLAIGSTTVDRTAATITVTGITVTANSGVQYPDGRYAAADGHIVSAEVTITTTEPLAADPVLDLGGFAMTQVACAVPAAGKYCYTHTVEDTEGEGNKFVTLTAEDRAGNITVKSQLQAVVYDFSGPRLVSDLFDRIPAFSYARDAIGKIQNYSIRDPLTNELVSVLLSLYADEVVADGTVTLNGFNLGSPTVSTDQVVYYRTLTDADAAGTYTLSVTWSDRLGNAATRSLSWKMAIDKTPTDAADIDMELVRFIRIPYGSEETAGLPRYKLEGAAGARLDGNIVMVTAYTASGSFAGQTAVNADDSFYMSNMSSGNVETVYLNPIGRTGASMMPAAGFEPATDLLPVENTRYIATMGYKVAGSDLANPHEWSLAKNTGTSLIAPGINTSQPVSGTYLNRRDSSSQESGTISKWIQLPTDVHPSASWRTNMCYDAGRGKLVLFGGQYLYLYNETWEWYDGKWNVAVVDDPEGDGEPVPISAGQMAYDNRRGVCVYYGGSDAAGVYMDTTWEWNGRSWKRIAPSDPEGDGDPVGISYGAMAYDIHRGVMVLAGGASGGANSNVYEYDGESWREMPRMSDSPGGPGVRIAYDRDRRVMVAAGGSNLGDKTLEYSGQKWITVCGGTTGCAGAPTRDLPMMAYDAKRKVIVYFGGRVGTTPYNELREWNGTSWTLKSPTGDIPAARSQGIMAYHEGRQTVILYGGIGSGSAYYFDTWEWDGTKWTRLSAADIAATYPTAKTHYAVAYDPSRNVTILHGGKFSSAVVSGETWEWNGYAWKKLAPATTVYRYGHSLVFDTTDNTLLMFGGRDGGEAYSNSVYQWNGTDWSLRSVAGGSTPGARMYHSAAYDSVRNRMVIFGGMDNAGNYTRQLYEWDNATRWWYYQTNSTIEARIHAGMTYDPVKQRIIVFGGEESGAFYYTGYGDTWEYNGATYAWTKAITNPWTWGSYASCPFNDTDCWENLTVTQSPMPRWGQMMVYDPTMRRTVLSGGMIFEDWSEGNYLSISDTWIYNSAATSWSKLDVINGDAFSDKSILYFHKGYYDANKGEVASWGGVIGMEDSQVQYSKTNVLRTGASEYPSQLFTVSLDAAGLAEGYAWRDIESISLSVYAGATVYGTTCTATNGVTLYGWANDRWLLLDQSPAARTAVTELKFSVNKPEIIQKLLNGEASELYFKIEAKDKAGCGSNGDPLIAVDYAELTVDIREDTVADRYFVSTSTATWANARTACAALDMDLAVITSQKEADLIESLIPSTSYYYWIGLNEPTTEGTWNWVNGLPAWSGTYTGYGSTWTDWALDASKAMVKPSDTSVLNCGLLYYYLGNWIWWDWGCANATYYICEKRDYSYSGVTGTAADNETACANNDGHLVSVNSELEEDAIWPFVIYATVNQYIGLANMSATDNIHTWQDGEVCWDGNSGTTGTAYGYTHWGSGEPNSTASDCVIYRPEAIYRNWWDYSCTAYTTYGGICEY